MIQTRWNLSSNDNINFQKKLSRDKNIKNLCTNWLNSYNRSTVLTFYTTSNNQPYPNDVIYKNLSITA